MKLQLRIPWPTVIVGLVVAALIGAGAYLYRRNTRGTNTVALADSAKRVSSVGAQALSFQPSQRYVGTIEPWVMAKVGPQLVSAYVDTVLLRPGAIVKRGEVVATLDCRHASAMSSQVAAQARALDAMSSAAASEAARVASLLEGKYVSENEVDIKKADAASKQAQLAALRAQMSGTALQVDDCVLRAPFDGEIALREVDPGAFVRPGSSIATVVNRNLVRIIADVPEEDFEAVAPGSAVRVRLIATKRELVAKISRRAPAADPATRTARIEIDIEDAARAIPVWTTAELSLDIGEPIPATALPLTAATVRAGRATMFVVRDGVAHQTLAKLVGERGGTLYVDPKTIAAGTQVVFEGRTILSDGDAVTATQETWKP